jgi:quercetin dioxygenase-like cupin family protein
LTAGPAEQDRRFAPAALGFAEVGHPAGNVREEAPMPEEAKPKAKLMRVEEAFWEQPPGHFAAFSKMLVHPSNAATRYFDFRISSYQPKGYAEVHSHDVAENIYYILKGKGIVELDGQRHDPAAGDHIPPGAAVFARSGGSHLHRRGVACWCPR